MSAPTSINHVKYNAFSCWCSHQLSDMWMNYLYTSGKKQQHPSIFEIFTFTQVLFYRNSIGWFRAGEPIVGNLVLIT